MQPKLTGMRVSEESRRPGIPARAAFASVLIAAALGALAITSVFKANDRATAQSGAAVARAPQVFGSVPLDSGEVGPFAFGYVEFDWDPSAPGGVPGFDSWPPGSPRR